MTRAPSERVLLDGPAGKIETVIDLPAAGTCDGVALVAHPHPLFGGSLDNKVAQTLAKTFVELGYVALRPNFRGVGASAGEHDDGRGETDDLLAVLDYARARFNATAPVLAGFSFGAYVQTLVARRAAPQRMALVGVAAGFVSGERSYTAEPVPADSIVIHGELDATVPSRTCSPGRHREPPIIVVPGADHFFTGGCISSRTSLGAWRG
jgi:alpha/beta superfamily hydrolase